MNSIKEKIAQSLKALTENCVDVLPQEELIDKLNNSLSKKLPLKLKIGFDPTTGDIHLGHTVLLRKLRKLQNLGHIVYFIIGDFTAKIGDPSGRSTLRPVLSDREIRINASTYTQQAFRILDKKKTKIVYNRIWYKKMNLSKFLSIISSYTVARVLERDDFSQRLKENKPLTILEIMYPLIQGYDSVMIDSDIEFGGTDQKFNLIVGRHLKEAFGQKPQVIITMPLLVGLDGVNKMSKSLGNYIGITEKPKSMFGKIMSISDEVMWEYFRLLTEHNLEEVKKMHPKEAKLLLASTIVSFYHSKKAAESQKNEFERVFSQKKIPHDVPLYRAEESTINVIAVLCEAKIAPSNNEARRLLAQGGISIIDEDSAASTVISEQNIKIPPQGIVLKIGKKKFLKVTSP